MKWTITILKTNPALYSGKRFLILAMLFCIGMQGISNNSSAQCTNTTIYPGTGLSLPTSIGQVVTITTCQYAYEYYGTVNCVSGYVYEFASSQSSDFITVHTGSYNGPVVAFGTTPVTWAATSATMLYVHTNLNSSCGQASGCRTSTVKLVAIPCSGQPTAGAASASSTSFPCQGSPILSLPSGTVGSGLEYQWQSRLVGTTTWANLGTVQTTPAYTVTTPITQSTQYRAWVKCTNGNLTDTSSPVTVTINMTAITPSTTTSLCTPPGSQTLTLTTPALPDTIFKERFEGTTSSWTFNNATYYNWGVQSSPYTWSWWGISNITSPGNNKFLFLNINNYVYSTAYTEAVSPSFSTFGYSAATLTFRHYLYYYANSPSPQTVEISTNGGSSWNVLGSYSGSVGSPSNFASVSITLASQYLNQSNVQLRFREQQYYPNAWAIDDIVITGTAPIPTYSWTASPSTGAGLPSGAGTPSTTNTSIVINPTATGSITYTGTATGVVTGCLTSKQVVMNVNPKPSANLSLTDYTICNGGTTNLGINFTTGTPPFAVTYTDGVTPVTTTINTTSANIPVSPNTSRVYKILTLTDPNCAASTVQIPDSVALTVHPRPTATLNNQSYQICDGTIAYLSVTLTGTAPFDITYYDGTNYTTINGVAVNNYQMPVPTTIGTTTYTITSLNDANCAALPGDLSGSNTVSGYVRPTASLSGNPTICNGGYGNVQVSLTGAPPYSFTYGDGGSFTYTVSNITSNPYTLTVTPSVTTDYNIMMVNDQNCASLSQDITGTSHVTVKNRPLGSLSGPAQTICHGNPVTLTANFTGTPPFSMMYTNGSGTSLISPINSNTYTFTTTPQTSGAYTISALTDANCVSTNADLTGSTMVTVRHPAATLSGSQISCTGGTANLLVDFSGAGAAPPYTFTYTDGQQTNTVNTTSDPYVLTVNTTGSTTFVLTAFNDANCLGDISGSAIIAANPNGGWNGNTSSDWQNPANWCGGLPTSTTDVSIPAIAPNMPVLGTGNGFSHHLTIEPGASMSIINGANFFLHGDLDNNGSVVWNTGNVSMSGGTAQTVDGFSCQNLFINNMDGVTPTQDINVNAILQLNGNIMLNNTDLIMGANSQIIGYDEDQYVHTLGTGALKRPVTTSDVLFPVGRSTYNPVTLANNGVQDEYGVRVYDIVYADGDGSTSTDEAVFPRVSRTWTVSEKVAGGSSLTVTPEWYNHPGEERSFFDRSHVFVRRWDGSAWGFVDSAGAVACNGISGFGPYSISESGYTTFSQFTVGGWNLWPLAIELLDFNAQLQDKDNALVGWHISESSEAQGFEVEHGTDGKTFTKVGEVSAIANKTSYSMTHRGLAEGRNYYRLKVTDNAGNTAYSKISVVTTQGLGVDIVSLSPNPVTGIGNLSVSSDEATVAEVRVMDAVGRVLSTGTHSLSQGLNNVVIDMNHLPQGNYTLHVITNSGNATPVKFTKL